MLGNYRFPPSKVVTVHNGADPGRFVPDPALRRRLRESWGLGEDALVIGTARRFVPEKGIDLAIEGFRQFVQAWPDRPSALILMGDGPEREALRRQAEESGVGDRIRFTGFCREPEALYPALDVFVMPSRNESFGIALAEAMLCGCLPVACRVGGIPEILSSPALGWLVPPEDPGAIGRALAAVAALNVQERESMRLRVRDYVARQFNESDQFDKIIDLIGSRTV